MKRLGLLAAALVFLACFAAYLSTLNPAFRADDSPETIAASVTLGIQHPPAYPLFTLVGRLFSLVPCGAPAWRLNMMAAFFGALTCALLCLAMNTWSGGIMAGVMAGVVLGLSKTFWSQALAAKGGIYTLHSAFMVGLFLCLMLWSRDRLRRWALLAVFVFALGFGNHWETQSLLAPATLAFALVALNGGKLWPVKFHAPRWQAWVWPAVLMAIGLSVYLYLPLRAQHSPFLNWGDPRDWDQFWWVFQRQEYLDLEVGFLKSLRAALFGMGPWKDVAETWVFVQRQGLRVLGHLSGPQADLGLACVALSFVGARAAWKDKPLAAWSLVIVAAFAFVPTFYFHLKPEMLWIMDVFLIPAYVVLAALAGIGAHSLLRPAWARAAAPLAIGLALFIMRAPILTQARQFIAWDYGKDLLLSAKPNAVILAEGDFNTMPVYYLQQVAHQRPDLDHVTTVFLSTDWGVAHARRVQPRLGIGEVPKTITGARAGDGQVLRAALGQIAIRAQANGRPIQASWFRQVQAENVREWEPLFRPSGLLTELNGALTPAEDRRRMGLLRALRTRHLEFDRLHLDPSPEFALSNYGTAYLELANYLRSRGSFAAARPLYDRAATISSRSNLAEIYTHHGIVLASPAPGQAPDLAGAAALFRQALQVKPLFEAYANLAGVCNQLGASTKQVSYYKEGEAAAREAVALSPGSAQALNNLAIAQYYQGRQAEALQTLRRAVQLAPADAQIFANLKALGG